MLQILYLGLLYSPQQQLVLGILRHELEVAQIGKWFVAHRQGLLFCHQQASRRAVRLRMKFHVQQLKQMI